MAHCWPYNTTMIVYPMLVLLPICPYCYCYLHIIGIYLFYYTAGPCFQRQSWPMAMHSMLLLSNLLPVDYSYQIYPLLFLLSSINYCMPITHSVSNHPSILNLLPISALVQVSASLCYSIQYSICSYRISTSFIFTYQY